MFTRALGPNPVILTSPAFEDRMVMCTNMARAKIIENCWNSYPDTPRYFVQINSSHDANPLRDGERFFDDHGTPQTDRLIPYSSKEIAANL